MIPLILSADRGPVDAFLLRMIWLIATCFPAMFPAAAEQGAPAPGVQILFSFHEADLQEALPEFGRLLDLSPVKVAPGIKGKVTAESLSPKSREAAFQIFAGLLRDNQLKLVRSAIPSTVYTVVPAAQDLPPDSSLITELPPAINLSNESTVSGVGSPNREPLRVSGNLQELKLIRRVAPVFPDVARNIRIAGPVLLRVVINEQGEVVRVTIYGGGHPLLQQPVRQAVLQWLYSPTYVNGKAVPVVATVKVAFGSDDIPPRAPAPATAGEPVRVGAAGAKGAAWSPRSTTVL